MTHYFAIDIGGTFVKYSIISDQGTIEGASKIATPKTLDELIGFISDFCASQQQRDLAGIAISSPGGVSESGIIYGSSAVHYLHGPNIKELIEASTGLPVHIENDANCAGYAEVWQGAAQGKKDVLVMVIGTSIGGASLKMGKSTKEPTCMAENLAICC
ncbi:N-acetylmannosamine kinase [Gracilibacillus boraciitolerans JCM 21714]|uniref:N-acetylmannosamine kinase n=1 Tax=Gracilibacillus boraciitolerans JCM 21714 TaxID=1298598 RepID=W4VPD1_9BACI|nr:ROK family protein [Gracilibacillus boraciitolerans]GAE95240.1 N-acetylmannosamine kinase [Gracilibacillus boraciitolerans JCM 21714]